MTQSLILKNCFLLRYDINTVKCLMLSIHLDKLSCVHVFMTPAQFKAWNISSTPQGSLLPLLAQHHFPRGRHYSDFCPHRLVWLGIEVHVNKIIQYSYFSVFSHSTCLCESSVLLHMRCDFKKKDSQKLHIQMHVSL